MPGLFYQPLKRRDFLKFSASAAAAFAATQVIPQALAENDTAVRLALLSDLHFPADPKDAYRTFLPVENLKTILPQIDTSKPAGVLINGDLARLTGEVADYSALKGVLSNLAAQAPIYMGLGNHDHREHFHECFDQTQGDRQKLQGKHVLVVEQVPVRILILDSLFSASKTGGLLGKGQRDWLAKYLKSSSDKPTVIFVHHTLGDGDNELLDAEALLEMAVPSSQVKAIFYGHSHVYSFQKKGDLHLVNIPAVGYNFSDSEPVGWVDAVFSARGVDLTLKTLGGNQKDNGKTTSLDWRA